MHLFGRGAELDTLSAALDEAAGGSGRVVGVVGEPGIGKTRLAEEAVALAGARGFATLVGRTPVRELAVAYSPFLEAVGEYLRALEPVAQAATTSGLLELGALFGSLVPGRVEPLSDPALEQARWFEAVARLLDRIQNAAPTVVFVDDVHEADAASLALLHYLCRRLQGQRVLVLLSYRSDADALRAVRDLRATLRRHDLLTEVSLAPLSRPDLAAVAARRLDGPASDELLDVLERHAGAVPLFVETMLLAWRDAGQLVSAGGCWTLPPRGGREPTARRA